MGTPFWRSSKRRQKTTQRIDRSLRLQFEPLEQRIVLTGQSGDVFAHFTGSIAAADQVEIVPIHIAPTDFTLPTGQALMGFSLKSQDGSAFNPDAVRISTPDGSLVTPTYLKQGVGGTTESLVIGNLGFGIYEITVAGRNHSTGDFDLNVFLVGDANGDHQVRAEDGAAIRNLLGKSSNSPTYNRAADVNRDGQITSLDYSLWSRNQGDVTTLQVLSLTAGIEPPPLTLSAGVLGTRIASSHIVGTATPGALVGIYAGPSGSVGNTNANPDGSFALPIVFSPGTQTVSICASDHFGQHSSITLQVLLDDLAPDLVISSANTHGALDGNLDVVGSVADDVAGVATLEALLDGNNATPVDYGPAGTFSFSTSLPLDGSFDGHHVLTLRATDAFGNTISKALPFDIVSVRPEAPNFDLSATSADAGPSTTTASLITLVGQTTPGAIVRLDPTGQTALASTTGQFQFANVPAALGDSTFTVTARLQTGATANAQRIVHRIARTFSQDDPVLLWDQAVLNAIRTDGTAPPAASRALAMVSAVIYDTVSSIENRPGLYVQRTAPTGLSIAAAVTGAARTVLEYLYPAQSTAFDIVVAQALTGISDNAAKAAGLAFGQEIGTALVIQRNADGWDAFVDQNDGIVPGEWRATAPMYVEALSPQWGQLTPFVISDPDQFQPSGPPVLNSVEWATAYNEVKSYGAQTGSLRTADQTQIARFWADGAGTVTPVGHWNEIALKLAKAQGGSIADNARLFAQLNLALGDTAIVVWDTKYDTNFWRPITAIHEGANDGNPLTDGDENWAPLLITPNFPEYVSGHSTFSSAAATILSAHFGDNVSFDATSPGLPNVTRHFTSFTQAAQEAGQSRIYGGIHYQFSNQDGFQTGEAVAQYVLDRFDSVEDVQSPVLIIDTPTGLTTNQSVTLAGTVVDNLSGVAALTMNFDDEPAVAIGFDAQGHFNVPLNFAIDGSADGTHQVVLTAWDAAGNQTTSTPFSFALDTRAPEISIASPTAGADLAAVHTLMGSASGTGSPIVALSYAFDDGAPVPIDTSTSNIAVNLNTSKLEPGFHLLHVRGMDAAGNTISQTVDVVLSQRAPFDITSLTPSDGAIEVGVTFRPKVVFSRPVDPTSLNSNNIYVLNAAGEKLPATIVPAADGSFAWLYLTNPLPGASSLTLNVDGSTILAAAGGNLLDADGDGTPGGIRQTSFKTVSLTRNASTSLRGRVFDPGVDLQPMTFDDIRAGADGALFTADDVFLNPLAHVKLYILGLEDQIIYTAADGSFEFPAVPVGDIKLVIDGRTATNAPAGIYFPEMVMDMQTELGQVNTVMGTMGTREQRAANQARGEVYLPRLQTSLLQPVSDSAPTTLTANAVSAPNLTPQQREQLKMVVQPGSILGPDGQPLAHPTIGISTVPASLVRDMLPPGVLQHTLDITIQAPGAATISTPIQLTFPNIFGAAPGTKLSFLSFDHTTGRLEIDGTATVSADGLSVTTDPDSGVTHPGWHGLAPVGSPNDPLDPPPDRPLVDSKPEPVSDGLRDYLLVKDGQSLRLSFGNAAPLVDPSKDKHSPDNVSAASLIVEITIDGNKGENKFLLGLDDKQTIRLPPQQTRSITFTADALSTNSKLIDKAYNDILYGGIIHVRAYKEGSPGDFLINRDLNVYRLLDLADDHHDDGYVDFPRTFADGAGGVVRDLAIDLRMPQEAVPQLTTSTLNFAAMQSTDSKSLGSLRFDPLIPGPPRSAEFTLTTPRNNESLIIRSRGVVAGTQTVTIDREVFIDNLEKLISNTARPGGDLSDLARLFFDIDTPEFVEQADALYDAIINDVKAIFATADPKTSEALRFLEAESSESTLFAYLWDTDRRVGFAINDGRHTESTSKVIELKHPAHFVGAELFIDRPDPGFQADLVLYLIDPLTGVRNEQDRTSYRAGQVGSDGKPIQSIKVDLRDPTQKVEVAVEHKGTGGADYEVIFHSSNADSDVQRGEWGHANWADFNNRAFATIDGDPGPLVANASKYSTAEEHFRFISYTNRSPEDNTSNDLPNKTTSATIVALDLLAPSTSTLREFELAIANTLAHEIGHDLGGIHMRDRLHTYIGGDTMGYAITDKLSSFSTFRPMVQNSLGLPAARGPQQQLFDYYQQYVLIEDYNFNASSGRAEKLNLFDNDPKHQEDEEEAFAPVLAIFAAIPTVGADLPDSVDSLDFESVKLDGSQGEVGSQSLYLINGGGEPLEITHIGLLRGNAGFSLDALTPMSAKLDDLHLQDPDLSESMLPITVHFDPTTLGDSTDTLVIVSNDQGITSTRYIPLSGRGAAPDGHLVIDAFANNFGGVAVGSQTHAAAIATLSNDGSLPLTINSIFVTSGGESFELDASAQEISPASPLVLAPGETYSIGATFGAAGIGLTRGTIQIISDGSLAPVRTFAVVGTGLGQTRTALDYGNDFVVNFDPTRPGANVVRLVSDDAGNWTTFMPANAPYHVIIFDPVSGLVAHLRGVSSASGAPTEMGNPVFQASTSADSDGDGLPDDIEFTIGTSTDKVDTDGDGVSDFAAIQSGIDPLGGRLLPPGVIGTIPGFEVLDLEIKPATNDPARTIAYVVTGTRALEIIDVTDPSKPVLLSITVLPGTAQGPIAVDQSLGIAATLSADGVTFTDVKNPAAPIVRGTVPVQGGARLAVAQGRAFVVSGNKLTTIDIVNRTIIDSQKLEESLPADSLVASPLSFQHERSRLYLYSDESGGAADPVLRIYSMQDDAPALLSRTSFPGRAMTVSGNVAYLTTVTNGFTQPGGYRTIDVSNPVSPELISDSDNGVGESRQNGPLQLNGGNSALSVFDTGMMLFDTSDPQSTNVIRAVYQATARQVTVANGYAYLYGESTNGLIIFNYLQSDTNGAPPGVSALAQIEDADPATPGTQIVENSHFPIQVNVADDSQLRSVELLINGAVVSKSLSLPLDFYAIAPIASVSSSVTIRVRATDTGGNTSLSDPIDLQVIADASPLEILTSDLTEGAQYTGQLQSAVIHFSKQLDPTTINNTTFTILDSLGRNVPLTIELIDNNTSVRLTFGTLDVDAYQFVIKAAQVTDKQGVALGTSDRVLNFTIREQATAVFISTAGDWNNPLNWLQGRIGREGDFIQLGTPEHPITLVNYLSPVEGTALRLAGLIAYGDVTFTGGLEVFGKVDVSGKLTVQGYELRNQGFLEDLEYVDAKFHDTVDAGSLTVYGTHAQFDKAIHVDGLLHNNSSFTVFDGPIDAGSYRAAPWFVWIGGDKHGKGLEFTTIMKQGAVVHGEFNSLWVDFTLIGTLQAQSYNIYRVTGGTILGGAGVTIDGRSDSVDSFYDETRYIAWRNVTLQGDFIGGPVGIRIGGQITLNGTIRNALFVVWEGATISGAATLIDPAFATRDAMNSNQTGLTLASSVTSRGSYIAFLRGRWLRNEGTLTAEGEATIDAFDQSPEATNSPPLFQNAGVFRVASDGDLTIYGTQIRNVPTFDSTTPLDVAAGGILAFNHIQARVPRINADTGATVAFGGILVAAGAGNPETILSGHANWLGLNPNIGASRSYFNGVEIVYPQGQAYVSVFRDGAFTLLNGAKLSGGAIFANVTFNGDFDVVRPNVEFQNRFVFYSGYTYGNLQIDGVLTLNGHINLGSADGMVAGVIDLADGGSIQGLGRITLNDNPGNEIRAYSIAFGGYLDAVRPVDLGPDITIEAKGGVIGSTVVPDTAGSPIRLRGTLLIDGEDADVEIRGNGLENRGQIEVSDGATLRVTNALMDVFVGGGEWQIVEGATVVLANPTLIAQGGVRRNECDVILDGADSKILLSNNTLGWAADFTNLGTFELLNGVVVDSIVKFTNDGIVNVVSDARLEVADSYLQNGGSTHLADGTIQTPLLNLLAGELDGYGSIDGTMFNQGIIRLDNEQLALHLTGDLTQGPWGEMLFAVSGPHPGSAFEQLIIDGHVQLGGVVSAELTGDYIPLLGDRAPLIIFATQSDNRLTDLPFLPLNDGQRLVLFRSSNSLDLLVVSSTGTLSLTPNTVNLVRNEAIEVQLGTLIDPAGLGAAEDYSAIIDWGDGTFSVESITAAGSDRLIRAVHRYYEVGHYDVQLTIVNSDGTYAEAVTTADVAAQALDVTFSNLTLTQGVTYASAKVASFVDAAGNGAAGDYVATIDWGDGTVNSGVVVTNGLGGFDVLGSHLYRGNGNVDYRVTVQRAAIVGEAVRVRSVAAPSALVASPTTFEAPVVETTSVLVATFVDPDEVGSIDKYSAKISWESALSPYSYDTAGEVRYNAVAGRFEVWGLNRFGYAELTGASRPFWNVHTEIAKAFGGSGSVDSTYTVVVPDRLAISFNFPFLETNTSYRDLWLASFTDLRGLQAASTYHATIAWGDGSTSHGSIDLSSGDGRILVGDDHKYSTSGFYTIQISLSRDGGPTTSESRQMFVYGGVVVQPMTFTPAPRTYYTGTSTELWPLGLLRDPNPDQPASGYTVSIDWGDGATSLGRLSSSLFGGFDVYGTHSYTTPGSYSPQINVQKTTGATLVTSSSIEVVAPLPLSLTANSLELTLTSGPEYLVASLVDPNFDPLLPNGYPATIDWGDGTVTSGRVSPNGSGSYSIYGTHQYAVFDLFTLNVSVTRNLGNGAMLLANATAPVQVFEHAPLQVTTGVLQLTENLSYESLQVGTFFDPEGALSAASYSAIIDWGDGTITTGTVEPNGESGSYVVRGNHTYTAVGNYAVTITASKSNGATGTGTGQVTVLAVPTSSINLIQQFLQLGMPTAGRYLGEYFETGLLELDGYQVLIEWGDEQTSSGRLQLMESGSAAIFAQGEHTYVSPGGYQLRVTVSAPGREGLSATTFVFVSFGGGATRPA